ncbi:LysE family translocator [Vibrio rumoiensis]|uniref:Lysine transporter LysE n=1 Tax=Vibrio rumoiensis 1S-45 TaxID=1188252 RepID=A0A1E5E4I5_9VIBR|nr:LysE family translocator [Vibrio rumoiensis]OEF27737.1 lysine transporter LysE [Vibrio rumoiensis 1S-45]
MTMFFAMAMFAFVTSISPGPVNILATVTGANFGYSRTVPHILGATIGFVSILFLLGLGFAQVISSSLVITKALTYLGGVFLLYLAYKVATIHEINADNSVSGSAPSLSQGILCQWLNPKAWIVSLSGISVFFNTGDVVSSDLMIFCFIFFIVCYASISIWAIVGLTIGTTLKKSKHYKIFNITMGGLLALSVVYVFFLSL